MDVIFLIVFCLICVSSVKTADDTNGVGIVSTNPFDQLRARTVNASLTSPASHLYLTTGAAPYVGFFYTLQVFYQV